MIRTADGWEIECQHSQTTLPLKSTDMESAKIKGRKLARQFENRYQTNKSDAGNGSEVICRVFIAYSSPLPRPPCYAPRIIMDIAKSIIVVGLAAVSAWLHIKDKDGSGWALLALLVLIFA